MKVPNVRTAKVEVELDGWMYSSNWRETRMKIELKSPYRPLLNDEAIMFLESIVTPEFQVFEYGSGASTIWLAQRVKHIISVENSLDWYGVVVQALATFEPRLPAVPCIVPFELNTDNAQAVTLYAATIGAFPDECFDLVFVDGEARPWCIEHARAKVKLGGWMVLDDADWKPVRDTLDQIESWEEVARFRGAVEGATDGGIKTNTTAFYRK